MVDAENRPILVPVPLRTDGKGHGEVSDYNGVSAWGKMTTEQKLQYQEYLAEAMKKYFQALTVTRGRVATKGDFPQILHPEELDQIKAQRLPDANQLSDMVNC